MIKFIKVVLIIISAMFLFALNLSTAADRFLA